MNDNFKEEVYLRYTDSAGNYHWFGTKTDHYVIPAVYSEMLETKVIIIRSDKLEDRRN